MITKVDKADIPGRTCHYNNNVVREIQDFVDSGWDACEVNTAKYKNYRSANITYRNAIAILRAPVKAVVRSGRVFLVRNGN